MSKYTLELNGDDHAYILQVLHKCVTKLYFDYGENPMYQEGYIKKAIQEEKEKLSRIINIIRDARQEED